MSVLTSFQQTCEQQLKYMLRSIGLHLTSREVAGDTENYIHAFIEDTNIEVWIYEDEAELRRGKTQRIFEAPDFIDSTQLISAFVTAVASELSSTKLSS